MDDVFEAARSKIGVSLIHSFFNSEGSYSRTGEYYILSPLRGDTNVGSFHINEDTGQYYDHATEESGDFIDLVSKAKGINLKEAAETIISESGGIFINPDNNKKKQSKKQPLTPPQIPIPDTPEIKESLKSRVRDSWCLKNWGKATRISKYYNKDGEWVFLVCRFEMQQKVQGKKRKKNDILFYLGIDNKWWTKWHDDLKPFPPYGIEKIKDNDLPILIVEGEKCAQVEVPGYNVISWIGGTSNMKKTNWNLLKGRNITIWPDTDSAMDKNEEFFLPRELQPGMKAAYYIKSQLPTAKILDIYKNKPLEDDPHGWDIADYVEEGGDPLKFIEEFTPYNSISVEIDPYQVYRKFIENYYDHDSLEQASGGFWNYYKDDHFWRKTTKNDILCNFQRWLEDTGLQWVISKKQKATTFINDTKQYLERHSLGYVGNNPFKDSALIPYIHFNNGAIHITKDKIKWFDRIKYGEDFYKKLYPVHCLDFDYDHSNYINVTPEKGCPSFYFFIRELIPKRYFDNLPDKRKKKAIEDTLYFICQVIAYSLSPVKPNEYFFGVYGGQRTGKSFMLNIIKSIVGEEFCVEKPITDMENRFASSGLWGKKVFIEPDLKTRKMLPEAFIKAYAGEQTITVEEKNLPAVDGVKISISMFFVSNYEFHTKGLEGLARRLIMIPYKNNIKKHDTRLLDKILGKYPHGEESGKLEGKTFDERPAIIALTMRAWERFCDNDFIMQVPEWAQREKDIWLIESNSVVKFMEERYYNQSFTMTVKRKEIYDQFKEWCEDEGRKPLGKKNFFEDVRMDDRITETRILGVESFIVEIPENEDEIPF